MKEINERIKTAEKKLVAALKKRVSSIDFDFIIHGGLIRKWQLFLGIIPG